MKLDLISKLTDKTAIIGIVGLGDVVVTYTNIDALIDAVGFKPATPLKDGIQKFVDWYKGYHGYN